VLSVIGLVDHPSEYAMIQNNLGNALQYAASGHPLENNLRALEAYDEALKVRNARDTPLEYANTIANKANVLRSLPDVADAPPGTGNLQQAQALYREARQIFQRYGQFSGMAAVDETLRDIASELQQAPPPGARYAADAL
jgi:tetratricopeptide (TPR) repeat protein